MTQLLVVDDYDVADHLRTPEEQADYLEAWLAEAPEDAEGLARARQVVDRARRKMDDNGSTTAG